MDQYEKQMIDIVNRHHALVTGDLRTQRRIARRIARQMRVKARAERRRLILTAVGDFMMAVLITVCFVASLLCFLIHLC